MVVCRYCKAEYDDGVVACFEKSGIRLEDMCCRDCCRATLVRTINKKNKEA